MVRSAGIDQLQGKEIPGLYVINVPKAVRSYYKIGISESDIEKRLASYILSYPFGFNIVAVLLFKGDPISRYNKVREAESRILKHFREQRVFRFKNMHRSEWIRLSTKKEINELKNIMQDIAKKDNAKVTWFSDTHKINLPSI